MNRKIWIGGFGNEYREDDGAGVILARRIYEFLTSSGETKVFLCVEHQLLPELAEELDVDWAIFCDADMAFHEEGFSILEISPYAPLTGFNLHSMGPEWLLALAERMGALPKKSLLVTVSGQRFDFSEEPTSICQARIDKAVEAFEAYWRKCVVISELSHGVQ
jgi:hydrogenase maturation protease